MEQKGNTEKVSLKLYKKVKKTYQAFEDNVEIFVFATAFGS